ncbi:MAG: thioredoxin family protein [Chitinispirillaceae bacterium]|nr:thioredoxin family protein [Chitinispirillaceae bacterium]
METPSTMLPLGTEAPPFSLPDVSGAVVSLSDFREAPALLVVFMCNHCPYVKHIRETMVGIIREYQEKGLAAVGINANDTDTHHGDRQEYMKQDAATFHYTFPYLFDETQVVAKAYHAACTPDFFLFNKGNKLVYRGQMDDSRPGNGIPVTGNDLRAALDAVLQEKKVPVEQKPSRGCNIKWKPGNEPWYFPVHQPGI